MLNIILGPPGTGKTETSIRTVETFLEKGVSPTKIGYFAFTRRANIEAKHRAMTRFGLSAEDLPFFRTLHSLAYSQLGITRGQLMTRKHYDEVSKWLKIGSFFARESDHGPFKDIGYGDKFLELINMARITQTPLEDIYNASRVRYKADWRLVDYVNRGLTHYKNTYHLLDYTDMLMRFVSLDLAPRLEVLIIDEAQDLSTLQWEMVTLLMHKAQHVFIAGDDDQAIYRWAGADVDKFLNLDGDIRVLTQSYRIPAKHHRISQQLIQGITHRHIKEFSPRGEEGQLQWHRHSEQVDLHEGEWLLLSRTTKGANQLEEEVRQRGYLYRYDASRSTDSKVLQAVVLWEKLRKGRKLVPEDIRKIYAQMLLHKQIAYGYKTLPDIDEDGFYSIEDLQLDYGLLTTAPWNEALGKISNRDIRYLSICLRKGEDLTKAPRITISTIHRAKGAQADNVVLLTDTSGRSNSQWRFTETEKEDETRVFYVGLTRARQALHLIHPMYSAGYSIPHA
jgi:superfamily I DNA/RNA helicase|tara:strand:- start:19333 stop:20853 length:1521 start_codon:yes stop_codon:yes gene_type:complete